jgi:hypothetical protein
MGELEAEGVGFQSTTEAIDTTTLGGKLARPAVSDRVFS